MFDVRGRVAVVIGGLLMLFAPAAARAAACPWLRAQGVDRLNLESPETAATYWVRPIVPGMTIRGRYPHARYMSFQTYDATGSPVDGLADIDIAPDKNSTNPFEPGASRTARKRSYTVHVVEGAPPAVRARNTVYTHARDKTAVLVELRVFAPDAHRDRTGGVGLPGCGRPPPLDDLSIPDPTPNLGGPSLLPAGASGLGGQSPPTWTRFTTITRSILKGLLDNQRTGTTLYPAVDKLASMLPSIGFLENLDTAYVFTFFTTGYGDVLAFRAKAPTTPPTLAGEPTMGTGQVRYWSMCTGTPATTTLGCVEDEQVPLDADGDYTVVISPTGARPANATARCGVAWLPAGPLPSTPVILRNMLAEPTFSQAIQNATVGTEQQTMGAYYPRGTYYAKKADFERLGCPVGG